MNASFCSVSNDLRGLIIPTEAARLGHSPQVRLVCPYAQDVQQNSSLLGCLILLRRCQPCTLSPSYFRNRLQRHDPPQGIRFYGPAVPFWPTSPFPPRRTKPVLV